MATLISDIKTTNWQVSIRGCGYVEQGLADIRQCLDIILRTQKGTDSLRPEFGSDLYRYIDYPVTIAVPNMKRAIIEAVGIWEKRIVIVSISHKVIEHRIIFDITYRLVDEELIDTFSISPTENTQVVDGLILQAFYPRNVFGRRYTIKLVLDNNPGLPPPPPEGFVTLNNLYSWVVNYWGYYGTWQQLTDRIILYANNTYKTGSISIELIQGLITLEAQIPALDEGQHYEVAFVPNGGNPNPEYTSTADNMEDLLSWVISNWGHYGIWEIVPGAIDLFGDFNSDFGEDFFTSGVKYYLLLTSVTLNAGTLNISIG